MARAPGYAGRWAIPASGITQINKDGFTLSQGTVIAAGSGKGTPNQIAEILVTQRRSGGPYFTTVQNEGKEDEATVSGQVGETKKATTVEVKEFILSK